MPRGYPGGHAGGYQKGIPGEQSPPLKEVPRLFQTRRGITWTKQLQAIFSNLEAIRSTSAHVKAGHVGGNGLRDMASRQNYPTSFLESVQEMYSLNSYDSATSKLVAAAYSSWQTQDLSSTMAHSNVQNVSEWNVVLHWEMWLIRNLTVDVKWQLERRMLRP